jgi:hypothetical protein
MVTTNVTNPKAEFIFMADRVGFELGREYISGGFRGISAFELDNDGLIDVFGKVDTSFVPIKGARAVTSKNSFNAVYLDEKFKPQLHKLNRMFYGGGELSTSKATGGHSKALLGAQQYFSTHIASAIGIKQAFLSALASEGSTITYLKDEGRFQVTGGKSNKSFLFQLYKKSDGTKYVRIFESGSHKIQISIYDYSSFPQLLSRCKQAPSTTT